MLKRTVIRCCKNCKFFKSDGSQVGACGVEVQTGVSDKPSPTHAQLVCDAHIWRSVIYLHNLKHKYGADEQ